MLFFYLDASALAKRYKPEKGTRTMRFIFTQVGDYRLASSFLIAVELAGAANRMLKSKVLSELAASELIARLKEDMTSVVEMHPVRDSIVALAVEIAQRHGLRAADSVHLATMLELRNDYAANESKLIALISDKALIEAALEDGIAVLNPEDDDAIERAKAMQGLEAG